MNHTDVIRILPGLGWHREDVKAELRKRYGSLAGFAKEIGLTRQSVSATLTNPLASLRTEKLIAGALGVAPHSIWPTRWRPDGKPVSRKDRLECVQRESNKMNKKDAA